MIRNLRATANSVTRVINPNNPATLYISTGYSVVNFKQIPRFSSAAVIAQVQPLTTGDIRHLDSLNIQGADKTIFMNGAALAISRVKKFGGDLIVFPDGTLPEGNIWLVKANLEQWGTGGVWCKCACALQDDTVAPTSALVTDLTNPSNEVVVPLILTGV